MVTGTYMFRAVGAARKRRDTVSRSAVHDRVN